MDDDTRKRHVLAHEGQALQTAGAHGVDMATDCARCQIDGLVNALIRLEGAEKTTAFLFQVADRAAGGLREPTAFKLPVTPSAKPEGGT